MNVMNIIICHKSFVNIFTIQHKICHFNKMTSNSLANLENDKD